MPGVNIHRRNFGLHQMNSIDNATNWTPPSCGLCSGLFNYATPAAAKHWPLTLSIVVMDADSVGASLFRRLVADNRSRRRVSHSV